MRVGVPPIVLELLMTTLLLRRGLFVAVFAFSFALACTPSGGGDDAGTTGDGGGSGGDVTDGGGTGGTDGGGGGGGGSLEVGARCTYGSDQCGAGKVCTSIFGDPQTGNLDTSVATCFAACDTAGAACDTAFDQQGTCQTTADGNVCVAASANLGPCGNGATAVCADTPLCLILVEAEHLGVCATACDPDNTTTCRVIPDAMEANDGCGCSEGLACSTSPIAVGMAGDGLCAPPTDVGDACGLDLVALSLGVCTGDQTCTPDQANSFSGTCQPAGDAGVADDAGM